MELSIIIPSFNTKELLAECLNSVFQETKRINFEVIVIDNASKDGSVEMVKKRFPKVKLIKLSKNIGFGRANNLGAKKTKGEWLLFLNSDTIVCDRTIVKTLDWTKKSGADVIGCKLLNKDGSIQQSVGFTPNLLNIFATMSFLGNPPILKNLILPYQQKNESFYLRSHKVDWVTGAFLMVKKALFEKVGGFDERFFMYAEEVDLCFRLKRVGARIWYTEKGKIIHLKGASSQDGFATAILGEFKGLISFFQKHQPSWQLPILKLTLLFGALLRITLFAIINPSKAKVYVQAAKEIF